MHRMTATVTIATDADVTTGTCATWCEIQTAMPHDDCQGKSFRVPLAGGELCGYLYRGDQAEPVLSLHTQSEPGVEGGVAGDLTVRDVDRLIDDAARFVGDLVRVRAQLLAEGGR